MEDIEVLKKLLKSPQDIVITSHRNPDGDAIGSSLGLFHYLNQSMHSIKIIVPSEFPAFLSWMPAVHDIMIHDIEPDEANAVLEKADIVFCLDFNSLDRIDKMGEVIGGLTCTKVMIDHHLYPEPFADFVLSDTTASSTCELVFDFISMLGHKGKIDLDVGECLYTGILTDTGSFKYATSAKLFRIAGNLLEIGVDDIKIQDLVFNSLTEKHLRIMGHVFNNRFELFPEFHTGIIMLSKQDYEYFDIKRGETEGLVNMMLKIKGLKVAIFVHEQPTITKISLRSKGDFSVQEIAQKHFKGGGHRNASGGYSYIGLRPTVKKIIGILPEYKEALDKAGTF
ncbi:MAG: phosphoesterase RecJ-like protein [Paraglaciecola sp.]|jgi:phosphoesterase RecJ-like protein